MNNYVIRLNEMNGYRENIDPCFKRVPKVLGVCHTGKDFNNPHFHFIIFTELKQPALRAHLKLYFNKGKGNKHLSVKKCDGNPKAWSYLFHEHKRETFQVIIKKLYTDDEIDEFIKQNDEVAKKMKETSANATMVLIYDELLQKGWKTAPPNDIVFGYIMRHYMTKEWLPNRWQCDRYIMKLQCMFLKTNIDQDQWINNKFIEWYVR